MTTNSAAAKVLSKPQPIASWSHLAGYLLITTGITAWGFYIQHAGQANAAPGQLIEHSQAIKNYIISILADLALLFYCWFGVYLRGGNLETLSGGRWNSWKALGIDILIALPFWVIWEATA